MNFREPELILVKHFRGKAKSYFQVSSVSKSEIELKDIEHCSYFTFPREQLEKHITDGVLVTLNKSEVPESLFVHPIIKKRKRNQSSKEEEMERRYKYVKAALDSPIPAYTAKWLGAWLLEKAELFDDPNPPSWRTLVRWINDFVESGWKKQALIPAYAQQGNRTVKIEIEVSRILDKVVREYSKTFSRVNFRQAHNDFLSRIELENQKREAEGLEPLKPSSYNTTVSRFCN